MTDMSIKELISQDSDWRTIIDEYLSVPEEEVVDVLRYENGTRVIVTNIQNGKIGFITQGRWDGHAVLHSVALDFATHWMPVPPEPT